MQPGQTGNLTDLVSQETGKINADALYRRAPVEERKSKILDHYIFIDKMLFIFFIILIPLGLIVAIIVPDATLKSIGSGMVGASIGALANRMKEGNKLNSD